MNAPIDQQRLLQSYLDAQRELRRHHARIGCVLAMILMPGGSGLDLVLYPHLARQLMTARILCSLALLPAWLLLGPRGGRRFDALLSSLPAVLPMLAICWMIAVTERELSPYYAGLMLMMLVVCQLLPLTWIESLTYCGLVTACYLLACGSGGLADINGSLVFNNTFFLVTTGAICITVCHLNSAGRYREFRLRYELDARNRQLEELDRLKRQFFANVSHELRTPLTLIIAPVDELLHRRPPLPEPVGQSLSMVRTNALRLLGVINDLLEVVRLEEGKARLSLSRIDLRTFVAGLVDSTRAYAQRKGLDVNVRMGDESLWVDGDASRLEKVLLNLLSNAIKFTPSGGSIAVHLEHDQDSARVRVSDTGVGIPQDECQRVFQRFHQVDAPGAGSQQGLGIGLALARELVEEHGGGLSLQSEPGKGSTFTVSLPIASGPSSAAKGAVEHAGEDATLAEMFHEARRAGFASTSDVSDSDTVTPADDDAPARECVLVIDDEPDMRSFLVSVLQSDYRVVRAADGETGLVLARRECPSVVVLDFMLPGMDGLDVCKAIRREESLQDTKVLILTARVDEGAKIESLRSGADDFLTKPFNSVEVKTRVQNLLRTFHLQRQLRERNVSLHTALEQLKATESQLVQSEKMNALGSLAGGLLHEINNPLNYTLLAIAAAKEEVTAENAELAETLSDAAEGLQRIHAVIRDLRTFAYPEQSSQHADFDIAAAVENARKFTAHECHGVQINVTHSGSRIVHGSEQQITQLLVNMLTNAADALKHSDNGRLPTVTVLTRRLGPTVEVCVSDNGPGIDDAVKSKIFDPFFTTRELGQRTGLGLSVCSTIAKNHGGSIQVASTARQGTAFTFELPSGQNGS